MPEDEVLFDGVGGAPGGALRRGIVSSAATPGVVAEVKLPHSQLLLLPRRPPLPPRLVEQPVLSPLWRLPEAERSWQEARHGSRRRRHLLGQWVLGGANGSGE